MIPVWLIYLELLALDLLLWLSIDGYFYYIIMRLLLLLPLLSLLLLLIGKKCLRRHIQLIQDANGCYVRIPISFVFFTCSRIWITGCWENEFYDTKEQAELDMESKQGRLSMPDLGSGVYRFRLQQVRIYDLLGLFRQTITLHEEVCMLRMPKPYVLSPHALSYIKENAGQTMEEGYGSDYDIRTYQETEPLRHIHYKASYRLQSIMVKEYQREDTICLRLYLSFPKELYRCEQLLGICHFLCLQANTQTSLVISWMQEAGLQTMELHHPAEAESFFYSVLHERCVWDAVYEQESGLCLDEQVCKLLEKEMSA